MPLKYKQLSFETSVRNPSRLKSILRVTAKYQGRVLDENTILEIVSDMHISQINEYEDLPTSDILNITKSDNIGTIKDRVIQAHSGRRAIYGFPGNSTGRGYCSRFAGYMQIPNMLGLAYARWEEKFELSEVGKMFIDGKLTEQEVFAIQILRFNCKNPYKAANLGNDYRYFFFLLNSMIKKTSSRLSYNQIGISTFSVDGNTDDFLDMINEPINSFQKFREILIGYKNSKNVDMQINAENTSFGSSGYTDQVRRILLISGLVREEQGFYYINERERLFIDELLKIQINFSDDEKTNAYSYFKKIGVFSITFSNLIKRKREHEKIDDDQYINDLLRVTENHSFNKEQLCESILEIARKRGFFQCSQSEVKIPEFLAYTLLKNKPPLMLEFLVSLLIHKLFGEDFYIRPSYKTDSNGIPTGYRGREGDIYVFSKTSKKIVWLIEVTKITNRNQQLHNETTTTVRHIKDDMRWSMFKTKYLNMVAPIIHDDTIRYFRVESILSFLDISSMKEIVKGKKFQFSKNSEKNTVYMRPITFEKFIEKLLDNKIMEYNEENWWVN